jgi:hypothetical protein
MMPEPKWEEVRAWAEGVIEGGRDALEQTQPESATQQIRGGIKVARALLEHFAEPEIKDPDKAIQPSDGHVFVGADY